MNTKQRIDADIKTAMLAGEKTLVTTLRGLKSAILYVEVAEGAREAGLAEEKVVAILQKEAKKRQESADLYAQGGNSEKQEAELVEKKVIEAYLPEQLSETQVSALVDEAVAALGSDKQKMGQIIGMVRSKSAGNADGALIARLVKERLDA
ncbi:MAG: GatB/YqeY domain-containing protein [Candidatus Saccharimonadales bacterium]